jgi:large subunit ribosomal protein L17
MRHKKNKRKLGRTTAHRKAMLNNMVRNILIAETITTTIAKAKEAQRAVEKIITLTKEDTLANKRLVYNVLQDHKLTSLVFKEIGPRFKNRAGGYTRIVHLDTRAGDGAKMAILSLVELKPKKSKTSPKKLKEKAVKTKEETTAPVRAEKQVAPKAETKKITPKETKKNTSEASKKDAEEKDKGFLKNLRSYLKKGNKE